ncbi:unnamed protein product [Rhizophagus irregularis]|nr:unnamed protein product [Rhizophagus irregularis]
MQNSGEEFIRESPFQRRRRTIYNRKEPLYSGVARMKKKSQERERERDVSGERYNRERERERDVSGECYNRERERERDVSGERYNRERERERDVSGERYNREQERERDVTHVSGGYGREKKRKRNESREIRNQEEITDLRSIVMELTDKIEELHRNRSRTRIPSASPNTSASIKKARNNLEPMNKDYKKFSGSVFVFISKFEKR